MADDAARRLRACRQRGCSFDGIARGCCAALLSERISLRGRAAAAFEIVVAAGMTTLYLSRPKAEAKTYGVSLMALGTAILLLRAGAARANSVAQPGRISAAMAWLERLSYELYLFPLVVLGGMRTALPARVVTGDGKLLLLAVYFVLSAVLASLLAWVYSDLLNRKLRHIFLADRFPA